MATLTQAIPSARQLVWHRLGFYGFIHFTMNTFTGREWGYGDESPALFNPVELDARQWARTARAAGMQGLILTCKHHDGFCLWPSRHTEHSVKNSPWRGGKGDVVRELSDACREFGLRFGVYLSPWDRNHPDYGRPEYIEYFRNQLRELLTEYGPIFEVWFDGANGGDGYYGGAREVRHIDRSTYYEWEDTIGLVRELQPDAVIFSDGGPDVRWVGNESGEAPTTSWATLNADGRYPGYSPEGYNPRIDLGVGHEGGTHWLPAEVDVSIRPGWFYHPEEDGRVRSPLNLLNLYMQSVGRSCNLLLNLPPDRRGLLPEKDVENLLAFAQLRDRLYARQVAAAHAGLDAGTLPLRQEADTRMLELPFAAPATCSLVELQEPVWCGQRVKGWTVQGLTAQGWQELAHGTTIGYRRLITFPPQTLSSLRVRLTKSLGPALLGAVAVFNAPMIVREPQILCDRSGTVRISAGDSPLRIRYTTDGSEPGLSSPLYEGPFALPRGGLVRAGLLVQDNPAALLGTDLSIESLIGLAKSDWRIAACSDERADTGEAATNLIDADPQTIWSSDPKCEKHPHSVTIDLGREEEIAGFGYLPRQEHTWGMVNRCAFEVSADGVAWTTAIVEAVFDNIAANPVRQTVRLEKPVRARFVRFVTLGAVDNSGHATAAGIDVYPAGCPLR